MPNSEHPIYEDILAILTGTLLVSLGLSLFNSQGLLSGGTAGIALLFTYMFPLSFGVVFFVINIPFYFLAIKALGWRFTLKTFVGVFCVSVMLENMHHFIVLDQVNSVFAGVVGGILNGVGILILFRHRASLGGLGILALYLQNKMGVRAGNFQLAVDASIVLASFFIVSLPILGISILGAIAMNVLLAINHKPGRYQATLFEEVAQEENDESDAK